MRALLLLAAIATLAPAQFHHFSGRVVDERGRPVEGAFFYHTDMDEDDYFERFTNAEGRFDIWTNAPRIVLRKAGYRGIVLQSEDADRSELKMRRAESFPVCGGFEPKTGVNPFEASFELSPKSQVTLLKSGIGIDYTFADFEVSVRGKKAQIHKIHNRPWAPMPDDYDVWHSVQYSERSYFVAGLEVIDAKGVTKEGRRWRHLIRMGEYLGYRDADPATAKLLDEFLDRTCLDLRP